MLKTRPRGNKNFFIAQLQLSMKFQLQIKTKMLSKINNVLALKPSNVVFILLKHVKMPTIVNNCWHFNIYKQDKFHAQIS